MGADTFLGIFIDNVNPPGREELLKWFSENLPETEINPLFLFGWNSGFISAQYDGTVSIDFDEESFIDWTLRAKSFKNAI